ncbi:MAG: DNA mismatch repair protein MutS, partial [Alphaproteobacteria bacterium]
MMAQYTEIKQQYPDCLLFYRMGDFYEMFFDDAVTASAALDITLTKRGSSGGDDIPMCGVPWHSHEAYLERLIRKGYKVAICEQTETPEEAKKRAGYKALVRREVVRVVTQGTLTEDNLLDRDRNNYLCALARTGKTLGLSWLDLSTGEFMMQPAESGSLAAALERLAAGEILIPDALAQDEAFYDLWADYKTRLTIQPNSRFDSENALKRLKDLFGVATLESFGGFCRAEIAAAGALIDYAELTQKGNLPRIAPPKQLALGSFMEIDAATRRNLELVRNMQGAREGSLLDAIDRTVTGGGGRLLTAHLSMPLTEPVKITERLELVTFFAAHSGAKEELRSVLKHCPDMERALARLSIGRGGPRDLAAIWHSLNRTGVLQNILLTATKGREDKDLFAQDMPRRLQDILKVMKPWGSFHPLTEKLGRALMTD